MSTSSGQQNLNDWAEMDPQDAEAIDELVRRAERGERATRAEPWLAGVPDELIALLRDPRHQSDITGGMPEYSGRRRKLPSVLDRIYVTLQRFENLEQFPVRVTVSPEGCPWSVGTIVKARELADGAVQAEDSDAEFMLSAGEFEIVEEF